MNIDATFLPVAKELIENVFPTAITYHPQGGTSTTPATGEVTPTPRRTTSTAGILSRGRTEEGGVGES